MRLKKRHQVTDKKKEEISSSAWVRLILFFSVMSSMAMILRTISLMPRADDGASSNNSIDINNDRSLATEIHGDPPQSLLKGTTVSVAKRAKLESLDPILEENRYTPEAIWKDMIKEAASIKEKGKDPGIFLEVGMFQAHQCLVVQEAGLQAHCVEASKANYKKIEKRIREAGALDKLNLYHAAAGSVTGRILQFQSDGGSGDRVGAVDVWNMEQNPTNHDTSTMTEVTEMRMDDIVLKQIGGAFMMKIDTQGFEPNVFAGLEGTLREHKAKFILLEYWPKGMDLMTAKLGDCSSVKVLRTLAEAGYKLFQLPAQAHPRAPDLWKSQYRQRRITIPLDDFQKNCEWYYELEKQFPSDLYKMGYWSDVLAIAPDVKLEEPVTASGKLLFP